MLNIISRSYCNPQATGPGKVVGNLIAGLEKISYPYVTNKDLAYGDWLWIHDDLPALKYLKKTGRQDTVIVGPNIIITNNSLPDFSHIVALQPSVWAKDFCLKFRFNSCPVEVWPTGMDTAMFLPAAPESRKKVLVYFKQRFDAELVFIEENLRSKNIDYIVIRYGAYQEKDYLNLLQQAKYVVWIGRQESQGVALQEALASDIPILVWDVPRLGHWVPTTVTEAAMFNAAESDFSEATAAPYFDDRCGYKSKDREEIARLIDSMENNFLSFRPRQYILENLSLEKQAQALLDIFKKYNPGQIEVAAPAKKHIRPWRRENLWRLAYQFRTRLRGIAK